jgi:hypothetical protein
VKNVTDEVTAAVEAIAAAASSSPHRVAVMVAAAAVVIANALEVDADGTAYLLNDCLEDSRLLWRLRELRQ